MNLKNKILFCAAVLSVTIGSTSFGSDIKKETTICYLSHHLSEMNGQYVHLKTSYETDFRHFAFFIDNGCVIDRGFNDENGRGIKEFDSALSNFRGEKSRKFYVEVSGIFRVEQNWSPPLILSSVVKSGPHGVLDLKTIHSFHALKKRLHNK